MNSKHRQLMDRKKYLFSNLYNEYDQIIRTGNIDKAHDLFANYLKDNDDPNAWMIYGQILLCLGFDLAARAVFRNNYRGAASSHIADVIHADCKATIAFVDDAKKILYIAIPKCGSTTVKNYLVNAIYSRDARIDSHNYLNNMMRLVHFDEFDSKYSDYFRFTIVRPAKDRVISYYYGNIAKGYLEKNSWDLNELHGLTSRPTLGAFMERFFDYRRTFIDVRHHTDPVDAYLPEPKFLDAIYSIDEIEEVRTLIEDTYQVKLESARLMLGAEGSKSIDFSPAIEKFYNNEHQYIDPQGSS